MLVLLCVCIYVYVHIDIQCYKHTLLHTHMYICMYMCVHSRSLMCTILGIPGTNPTRQRAPPISGISGTLQPHARGSSWALKAQGRGCSRSILSQVPKQGPSMDWEAQPPRQELKRLETRICGRKCKFHNPCCGTLWGIAGCLKQGAMRGCFRSSELLVKLYTDP